MGRYANPQFLREDAVPRAAGDIVFRQTFLGKVAWLLSFLVLAAGCFSAPSFYPELPPVIGYFGGVSFALCATIAGASLRAALRATNWTLRVAHNGLYLKFRSYRNYDFSPKDPVVLFIPRSEIARLAGCIEDDVVPARDEGSADHGLRRQLLLIQLHQDCPELAEQLRRERERWSPGRWVRGKVRHYPVRLLPGGLIEVDWSGLGRLHRALAVLGRSYPVGESVRRRRPEFDSLTRAELEGRLIDFAERGDMMSAVLLAKRLYGFDTTEARTFVESLNAPAHALDAQPSVTGN